MRCKNCGAEISGNAYFCGECGALVTNDDTGYNDSVTDYGRDTAADRITPNRPDRSTKRCRTCGAIIPASATFCDGCGTYQGETGVHVQLNQKETNPLMIVLICVIAVVVIAAGVAVFVIFGGSGSNIIGIVGATPTPQPTPQPTQVPQYTPSPTAEMHVVQPVNTPLATIPPIQPVTRQPVPDPVTDPPITHQYSASYASYSSDDYSMTCEYPSNFELYNDPDTFVLYSLRAPDGSGNIKICGVTNGNGRSAQVVIDNFVDSYPGRIDKSYDDGNMCEVSTVDGDTYHYGYFSLSSGMIRGFEFHFDARYYDEYMSYVNDIRSSIEFN